VQGRLCSLLSHTCPAAPENPTTATLSLHGVHSTARYPRFTFLRSFVTSLVAVISLNCRPDLKPFKAPRLNRPLRRLVPFILCKQEDRACCSRGNAGKRTALTGRVLLPLERTHSSSKKFVLWGELWLGGEEKWQKF
jgi:hypothetical protein